MPKLQHMPDQQPVRRNIPPIPGHILSLMESDKVYIFNVGPWEHVVRLGSLGTFTVPKCEDGEDVSKPLEYRAGQPGLPAVLPECNYQGDNTWSWSFDTTGRRVAQNILGHAGFSHSSNDLTKYGVFIAAGSVPTESEINAAREKLYALYDERVRQADQAFEINGGMEMVNGTSVSTITKDHVQACKALGLEREWAKVNKRMVPCPACDESVKPGAAICQHCDAILDEEKARKFFPHKFGKTRKSEAA